GGTSNSPEWMQYAKDALVGLMVVLITGGAGLAFGPVLGASAAIAGAVSLGASPALTVDQGTVTWSDSAFISTSDAPTVVVNGGTLILENNFISGGQTGSRPVIEVDGGTLILGGSDETKGNGMVGFGAAPFISVSGGGKVIVEPGNDYAQFVGDGLQATGATGTQLVSSAPNAMPCQTVTFTATITAEGAPASDEMVEFFDYTTGAVLGTAPVEDGSASVQAVFNSVTAGDQIFATYLPTSGSLRPSSGQVIQMVSAGTKTIVTGPSTNPVYGQPTTFTATITAAAGGTPTGSV